MSFPPADPLLLVIFDCDGVLVDSEGPANRAVAVAVSKLGWAMDEAESMRLFVGFTLEQITPMIETRLGRPVPDGWIEALRQRIIDAMSAELELVPGVLEALAACDALGVPVRVASNSSRREIRAKFARTGLERLLPRVHCADDVAHGKPAPDVFLAAAAAEGVAPAACLVIEDSVPGATGARAAGMACLGYAPGDDAPLRAAGAIPLRAAGATPFHAMSELPSLFRAALRRAA